MKDKLHLLSISIIIVIVISCTKETVPEPIATDLIATDLDIDFFSDIEKLEKNLKDEVVWTGYYEYFINRPIYLVHRNKQGKLDRGFILHPKSVNRYGESIEEVPLESEFKVYRFDSGLTKASKELGKLDNQNIGYDLHFDLDGKDHYLQSYTDESIIRNDKPNSVLDIVNQPSITIGSIGLMVHEIFHIYQHSQWRDVQEESVFFTNRELIKYRLLTLEIFMNLPSKDISQAELERKLKQFIAIRTKQIQISSKDMNAYGEFYEGSAHYMEKTMLSKLYKSNGESFLFFEGTRSFSTDAYADMTDENVLGLFENMVYFNGASIIHLLFKLNTPPDKSMIDGQTPFEIARAAYPKLNNLEIDNLIKQAEESVEMKKIDERADEWAAVFAKMGF